MADVMIPMSQRHQSQRQRIVEASGWHGAFDVIVRDKKTGAEELFRIPNRLTNAGLNLMRDGLRGVVTDTKIKYLAVGTNGDALDDTDTQLGAEAFRTAMIAWDALGTGVAQITTLVLDSEAVVHILEFGVFAGATAGAGANTGVMVSRVLWDRNKTALESIQFVRTDTIGRA